MGLGVWECGYGCESLSGRDGMCVCEREKVCECVCVCVCK